MKILTGIDIPFNPFGGSPIICDDWYSGMPADIEVLFLAMPPTSKRWWKMKNVQYLKTKKVKEPNLYPVYIKELTIEIQKIVDSYKPDVIHMQHLNFGLSRAFVEASTGNIPKIGICHGTDVQSAKNNEFFKNNLINIVDRASALIFPSQNMAKDFFTVYKKEKSYSVIPHGIPEKAFDFHATHKFESKLKLLYAGRLNYYKGADIAIEATLNATYPVHLDVIGNEDEVGCLLKLHGIVDDHNLSERVSFFPQISRNELWKKFSNYDAIIIPSRQLEAFSLTAIEAQARGLPVIYGNGGGISEVVGSSGVIIKDNNQSTLVKIINGISTNKNILQKYRKLGYKNATKYKLITQIDNLVDLSIKYINNSKGQYG